MAMKHRNLENEMNYVEPSLVQSTVVLCDLLVSVNVKLYVQSVLPSSFEKSLRS